MIYGYVRVSTKDQSIERQIRNIKEYNSDAIIINEGSYTGTKLDRPQFQKLLSIVKSGDTIIFDSVSRMSRTADEGFKLYEKLFNDGINLIFIKESVVNTEMYKSKMNSVNIPNVEIEALKPLLEGLKETLLLLAKEQFKEVFKQSEKEVMDLRQRTKEGMLTAKINGKQIGGVKGAKLTTKKSIEAKQKILKYSKDFNGSLNDVDTIKLCSISRNSYYKYKKELKEM